MRIPDELIKQIPMRKLFRMVGTAEYTVEEMAGDQSNHTLIL